jgi:hypothetical protein
VSTVEGTAGLLEPFAYGRGFTERIFGTSPGAGSAFTFPMVGQYNTRAVAVVAQLATSAAAANRWAELRALDADGNVWERWGGGVIVLASSTLQLVWQDGRTGAELATAGADATPLYMPLTPRFLEGGDSLRIFVGNMQAGDALTGIRLTLERFPTGPRGYPEGVVPERLPPRPR